MAFKTGQWPEPKPGTIAAIRAETVNARNLFPDQLQSNLEMISEYAGRATVALVRHHEHDPNVSAVDVWSAWVKVAVLAVRIIEEGSREYDYAKRGYEPFSETNDLPLWMNEAAEKFRKGKPNVLKCFAGRNCSEAIGTWPCSACGRVYPTKVP